MNIMERRELLRFIGIAPIGMYLSLKNPTFSNLPDIKKVLIEAHRGNSVDAPENTLTAIEQAIEIGVDRVEVDLEFSKDGNPVIIHDNSVDRTTNGTGNISDLTYSEIRKLDAGNWKSSKYKGEKVPLLSEVFELCKGRSMVNIDLKNSAAVPEMVKTIKDMQMENEVVITGKIPECVNHIRELGVNLTMFYESTPQFSYLLKSGQLSEALKLAINQARFYCLPGFLFNSNWITPELVYQAHLHGLAVNVWDVNTLGRAKKMFEAGVDAVMSDNPALFI